MSIFSFGEYNEGNKFKVLDERVMRGSAGIMLLLGFIAFFTLSLFLLSDVSYFEPVCMLCIICLVLLYLETAFGICIGCKIYQLTIKMKIIPVPKERPNCMGDSCRID